MPLPSENSISGLSDELLQEILVRLGSARAAAGTSVLSRRWRHVWADVPKLILDGGPNAPPSSPPASFLDVALDAHAAPTVQRLLVPQGLGWSSSLLPVELPVCGRAKRSTLQLREA